MRQYQLTTSVWYKCLISQKMRESWQETFFSARCCPNRKPSDGRPHIDSIYQTWLICIWTKDDWARLRLTHQALKNPCFANVVPTFKYYSCRTTICIISGMPFKVWKTSHKSTFTETISWKWTALKTASIWGNSIWSTITSVDCKASRIVRASKSCTSAISRLETKNSYSTSILSLRFRTLWKF